MIRLIVFVFFFFLFFIEFSLFAAFAEHFGGFLVIVQVLGTMMCGMKLLSSRPFAVVQKLQQELASGGDPREILFGGLRAFIGGILFVIPGIMTDLIGLWLWFGSLAADKRSSSTQSDWAESESSSGGQAGETQEFNEAWQGDEFSERLKGKAPADVENIVDATIISTEDADSAKKK